MDFIVYFCTYIDPTTMPTDWKDALAALNASGTLPEGEEHNEERNNDKESCVAMPTLRIILDRKGRKGKTATIIEGFTGTDEEVTETARHLKQKIGTGGSSRGGEILLQGDWRDRAAELLRELGYKTKT